MQSFGEKILVSHLLLGRLLSAKQESSLKLRQRLCPLLVSWAQVNQEDSQQFKYFCIFKHPNFYVLYINQPLSQEANTVLYWMQRMFLPRLGSIPGGGSYSLQFSCYHCYCLKSIPAPQSLHMIFTVLSFFLFPPTCYVRIASLVRSTQNWHFCIILILGIWKRKEF